MLNRVAKTEDVSGDASCISRYIDVQYDTVYLHVCGSNANQINDNKDDEQIKLVVSINYLCRLIFITLFNIRSYRIYIFCLQLIELNN